MLLLQHRDGAGSTELCPYMVLDHEHYTTSIPNLKESRPQSAFQGATGYNPNSALAIPNAELARLGV